MLTVVECKAAQCPIDKKWVRITDGGGLYLEVRRTGSKLWFWKYRKGSTDTRIGLGSFPDVSLSDARLARDAARIQRKEGGDPLLARKIEKLKQSVSLDQTLESIAREWIAIQQPHWSQSHYVRELRNLEKDLIPYLGKRRLAEIEPIELLATIRKVEARGVKDVPSRVLMTAGSVWKYAVASARATRDITPDIKKALKPHTITNYPAITDPTEFAELLRASINYRGGPVVRAALRVASVLFQRPGNLRTMRWKELDLDNGLWFIPSEDMKRTVSEKKNGKAHVVPLPKQIVDLLKELEHLTGKGEYVFPGFRNRKAPMSEAGVNAALHAMGYKGRHCWHGYRASGRTILRQVLKFPVDVIEAQLAHTGQITHKGAYDRATHLDEREDMLQVWANYLDKLVDYGVVKMKKMA